MLTLVLDGYSAPAVIGCTTSDAEVLRFAEAQFNNPPPVLKALMERYVRLLDKVGDQQLATSVQQRIEEDEQMSEEEAEEIVSTPCPGCGCRVGVAGA
jgi:hypothetical protein